MAGISLEKQGIREEVTPPYYSVKEAVFPFIKFPNVDTVLGPEMKSTGEVMGVGLTFGEAFDKSQKAAGYEINKQGSLFVSLKTEDQSQGVELAKYFHENGYKIYATEGTGRTIRDAGMPVTQVNKVKEGRPHVVDMIKNGEFDLIFNTTAGKQSLKDSYTIRREALMHKVTYFTTLAAAKATVAAHESSSDISINKLQALHRKL